MADEGFHEIQLGKKQLFFAFMAATVFTVVVFLLGVWVGKDMRQRDPESTPDLAAAELPSDAPPPPTQVPSDELDYSKRLQTEPPKPDAGAQTSEQKPIEPPIPVESEPPPVAEPPASAPPATAPAAAPAASAPAQAAKGGFTWQVGAFNDTAPADALANRLKAKNYPAYVFHAPSGPQPFKVRVGPYANRADADRAAGRLRREERLSPFPSR